MSAEEKRQVMLSILHESKTPFLLKELEKIGGKRGVGTAGVAVIASSLHHSTCLVVQSFRASRMCCKAWLMIV